MITVHCIFNAHLDPIWLWPWTAGLDEAIATCRSACDRLDRHPDIWFTQGEAWTFAMVERADPGLFARIRRHVESGRWELAGGWWTQPDCNFPSLDGLRGQIRTGFDYLTSRFGKVPRCAFNPDTFGHCAILPELLREFGQDRYVFMRPQEHEKKLPARAFTWRTRPGGPAVTAFRIAGLYNHGSHPDMPMWPLWVAKEELPPGCTNTMAFFGVGDHGGGPTEETIRWIREHLQPQEGMRLEFSNLGRAMDAIERESQLPEVVGEVQMHAIGCYAIERGVKGGVRRAEHALARAATVATADDLPLLERAWRSLAAHQFHDTLGGTCIPEAYRFVHDDLGGAVAAAEEVTAYAMRRQLSALADDPLPRLVLANPGAHAFSGWHEARVWTEGPWNGDWRLLDAAGREVPYQHVEPEIGHRRVLLRAEVAAGGLAAFRLDLSQPRAAVPARVSAVSDRIGNDAGMEVRANAWGQEIVSGGRSLSLGFHLVDDPTDTWSHGISRYAEGPSPEAHWERPEIVDRGPLRAAFVQRGEIAGNRLIADWRLHAGEAVAELVLDVDWRACQRVLKLVLPLAGEAERLDGTPGMGVVRANEARELPLHDWTRAASLGVVCPDAWAIDADRKRLRLTLLRAPFHALHDPVPGTYPRAIAMDQGLHRFRFRIHLVPPAAEVLAAEALAMHRPLLDCDLTRGMPTRMSVMTKG